MWKKLSSKTVYENPWIEVIKDEVLLPNGKHTEYVRLGNKGSAVTLICEDKEGNILLQEEYHYPTGKTLTQFPGGIVLPNEDVKTGANRELMEESSLKAGELQLLGTYYTNSRRTDQIMFVFLARNLTTESLPEDDEEDIKSFWVSKQELDDKIQKGEIPHPHVLAPWLLAKNYFSKTK